MIVSEYFLSTELNKPMKHRKVKHYGYEFIYGKNNVDKNSPLAEGIPEICKPLICKMIQEALIPWEPDQLTVNQYEVGQGISYIKSLCYNHVSIIIIFDCLESSFLFIHAHCLVLHTFRLF